MNLLERKYGRWLIAFAFYFAEGAPIGFIWWALPTILKMEGIKIDTITAITAILTLPWVFKFLWAPLIDIFRTVRFGHVHWIGISQSFMCFTLIPLIFIPIEGNVSIWVLLLVMHSFFASIQDVSVDSLIIHLSNSSETGAINGFMQAGMLIGRSIFGGGTLLMISRIGLPLTLTFMIACIGLVMSLLLFIKVPNTKFYTGKRLHKFKKDLYLTFSSKRTWYTIGFALTAAAAFEAVGAMVGPFLSEKGFTNDDIGILLGLPVIIAMIAGSLMGGYFSDKWSRKNCVLVFLFFGLTFIAILSLIEINGEQISPLTWKLLLFGMYLGVGMFTSSSYALFMDVTNPKLGATQFSTFMAITNGCEAWSVWVAGFIAATQGYGIAFLAMCLISLASIYFLLKLNLKKKGF